MAQQLINALWEEKRQGNKISRQNGSTSLEVLEAKHRKARNAGENRLT